MLDVFGVHFSYAEEPVLKDIHFKLAPGELLHLQGVNGSGKSTLLKLLAGVLHPEEGYIRYQGQGIHDNPVYFNDMCYVGHKLGVSSLLSPKENCVYDLKYKPQVKISPLLEQLSLQDVIDVPCGLLSAGQQRKVGLLRLKTSMSKVWILDEPYVALDKASIGCLDFWIEEHVQAGGSVVMSSHQEIPAGANYREYCLG